MTQKGNLTTSKITTDHVAVKKDERVLFSCYVIMDDIDNY